jgi:uncharacterized membrane protein YhaH (DUF805 family)
MPAKKGIWKFFQALTYVNTLLWILMFAGGIFNIYDYSEKDLRIGTEIFVFIVTAIFALSFNILNIYIIHRFLPARKIVGWLKFSYIAGVVFWLMIFLLLFITALYGVDKEFFGDTGDASKQGKIVLLFVTVLDLIILTIAVLQLKLLRHTNKNHAIELDSVVQSIGMEKIENE